MTLHKLLLCHSSFIGEPFCYVQCLAITFWWLANRNSTAHTFEGCWGPIFPQLVIAMLIALAKFLEREEPLSIHLLWATEWLLVIRFSLVYLVDEFFFLFMVLLNKMRRLDKSKVSGVNQGNEGGRWVQDFLMLPRGLGTSHQSFCKRDGVFSACGVFISN